MKVTDTNPFPWSTVVHIRGKFGTGTFNCSGWMLGVSTVVTAGHCLYDFGNSNLFASNIVVTPAQNTDSSPSEPFGNCEADRVWIINVWQDTGDSRYDYGVIGLTCRVGERTGNLGYRIMADDVITGTRVNVTGYPGDKGGTTMWFGLGNVTDVDQHYLYYNNDTMGSQSGSPVWELINDDCEDCVVAIHSGANPPANTNIGVRVDSYLFDFLIVLQQWQYGRAFLPLILKPQPTPRNTPCFGC